MNKLIAWFGGRRFVMTMGCGIACTGLLIIGRLTGAEFVAAIGITVAAYITGGSAQHIMGNKSE